MLHNNTWNHLAVCKRMTLGSFQNVIKKICFQIIYINYICTQMIWYSSSSSSCRATLSRHFSLSFIASGRSSGLHPVSSHGCCVYVRASRPAFAWPYARVHRSTPLMSSSLLLQQYPACLVRLTWIVFVMAI